MKKIYIKPCIIDIMLEIEPVMTASSSEMGGINVGDKPVGGETPDLYNRRRNDWGDIWKN